MMSSPLPDHAGETARNQALRRLLLALLVFGMAAVAADLYLLGHFEEWRQVVAFATIELGLVAIAWHVVDGGAVSVRALQAMATCLVAGVVGVVLHFRGNMEFQLDINPALGGWKLFNKVIRAKAPPAMAPGAMTQLGLLGPVYCYRHPALARARQSSSSPSSNNSGD